MTLEDMVRDQIGASGPQLSAPEYHDRIEDKLSVMKAADLLRYISMALEDAGVFPPNFNSTHD